MRHWLILAAALTLPACGRDGPSSSDPKGNSPSVPPWAKVAPSQVDAAKQAGLPLAFQNAIGMRFVLIPAGTFTMGDQGPKPRPDEQPHKVTLTKPYYMAITETTNLDYRKFKATHDSRDFQGDGMNADAQPAAQVSYHDAVEFATWLSSQDSARVYRLPTEAEWEFACRAGTKTRFWWGEDVDGAKGRENVLDSVSLEHYATVVRYKTTWRGPPAFAFDDGFRVTAPVATFEPNPWGLYDMLGNIGEICGDWYDIYQQGAEQDPEGPTSDSGNNIRVVRGGDWKEEAPRVGSAYRAGAGPDNRDERCGFRLVAVRAEDALDGTIDRSGTMVSISRSELVEVRRDKPENWLAFREPVTERRGFQVKPGVGEQLILVRTHGEVSPKRQRYALQPGGYYIDDEIGLVIRPHATVK